jgi:hypothetical protein
VTVVWAVAPFRLVVIYRRFKAAYCHHQHGNDGLMIQALSTSETLIIFYSKKYPRRQSTLYSPQRENELLQICLAIRTLSITSIELYLGFRVSGILNQGNTASFSAQNNV